MEKKTHLDTFKSWALFFIIMCAMGVCKFLVLKEKGMFTARDWILFAVAMTFFCFALFYKKSYPLTLVAIFVGSIVSAIVAKLLLINM